MGTPHRRVFVALLFFVTAASIVISVDGAGKCVMRGICDADGTRAPCVYSGEPKPIESAASRGVLETICGDVLGNVTQPLCCDGGQAEDFSENLQSAKAVGLDNCPACSRNFRALMCHMLCSPRQADFMQLLKSEVSEDKENYVSSLNYYVTPAFVRGMFDSCKDARSKIPSISLFNFMCGRWHTDCTGRTTSKRTKNTRRPREQVFKPLSVETFACNQSKGSVKACSCENCKPACS
ncbi:hypothetical protein MTO96_030124 [Rhipicephalus appendiculatus]